MRVRLILDGDRVLGRRDCEISERERVKRRLRLPGMRMQTVKEEDIDGDDDDTVCVEWGRDRR